MSLGKALVVLALGLAAALAQVNTYDSCMLVNQDIDYRLYWSLNETEGFIYVSQSANVDGWLGFGLSEDGKMTSSGIGIGSDILAGYVDSAACANGCIYDYTARFHDHPVLDATQNVELRSATKTGGRLTLEWRRRLNTGDTAGDRVINPATPQYIIWSANKLKVPASSTTLSPHTHIPLYHGPQVNFMTKSRCPAFSAEEKELSISLDIADAKTFDLGKWKTSMAQYMGVPEEQIAPTSFFEQLDDPCPECLKLNLVYNNYQLTGATTEYTCHGFALPVDKDRHITAFEIVKDNVQVLHHIVVYQTDTPYALDSYIDCSSMPSGASPIWAWAPGTVRYVLPPNVGVPIGPNSAKYFVFQVHYNNPGAIKTFTDSSGIKIYISDTIRQFNAGFMLMWGLNGGDLSIPPNQPSWHLSGGCSPTTTNRISQLPGGKINIIGEMHHMHLYGKEAWTDIERGGVVVRRFRTPVFDYNSQKMLEIEGGSYELLPGDTMRTHCIFNSTGVSRTIRGCESTECEMCLYNIMYYPQIPVRSCNNAEINSVGKSCTFPCGY